MLSISWHEPKLVLKPTEGKHPKRFEIPQEISDLLWKPKIRVTNLHSSTLKRFNDGAQTGMKINLVIKLHRSILTISELQRVCIE